jgi:O-antigen/teichoic acid export membrane protein
MFLLIPMQFFLVCTSWWWIPKGLGSQWQQLIPIYNLMAVYGLARAFFDDVPNVLTYGFRNPWVLTQSQALQAFAIILIGFLIIPYYGAWGSAFTMSLSMLLALVYVWYHVLRATASTKDSFYAATRDYWHMIKRVKDLYEKQK